MTTNVRFILLPLYSRTACTAIVEWHLYVYNVGMRRPRYPRSIRQNVTSESAVLRERKSETTARSNNLTYTGRSTQLSWSSDFLGRLDFFPTVLRDRLSNSSTGVREKSPGSFMPIRHGNGYKDLDRSRFNN